MQFFITVHVFDGLCFREDVLRSLGGIEEELGYQIESFLYWVVKGSGIGG
jgi:hypothetical protein